MNKVMCVYIPVSLYDYLDDPEATEHKARARARNTMGCFIGERIKVQENLDSGIIVMSFEVLLND